MFEVAFVALGVLGSLIGVLFVSTGVYATFRASVRHVARIGNHVTIASRGGGLFLTIVGIFLLFLTITSLKISIF